LITNKAHFAQSYNQDEEMKLRDCVVLKQIEKKREKLQAKTQRIEILAQENFFLLKG